MPTAGPARTPTPTSRPPMPRSDATQDTALVRVFLTGATGFVGGHVVRALSAAGYSVTALVRHPSRAAALHALPGVSCVTGDLRRPAAWAPALAGHTACIHLGLCWPDDPADDLRLDDLRATAALLGAAADAGVGQFVYTSSTAVHRPWSGVMDARSPLRGADLYAATKASGELLVSAVCGAGAMRGAVLCVGPVVGEAAWPGGPTRLDRRAAAMLASARRGETLRVPRGDGRQWIAADDLARLYVALLGYTGDVTRFVAVAPEVIPWVDVAEAAVEVAGSGRVETVDDDAEPAVFDVAETVRALGAIGSARAALHAALRGLNPA